MNVVTPIDKLVWKEIPWAKTVQGLTPWFAVISNVSPIANKDSPSKRKTNVLIFGLKFNGFDELQVRFGIFFIFKISSKFIYVSR